MLARLPSMFPRVIEIKCSVYEVHASRDWRAWSSYGQTIHDRQRWTKRSNESESICRFLVRGAKYFCRRLDSDNLCLRIKAAPYNLRDFHCGHCHSRWTQDYLDDPIWELSCFGRMFDVFQQILLWEVQGPWWFKTEMFRSWNLERS